MYAVAAALFFLFAACGGNADDGSEANVVIMNDNVVYYDELSDGGFDLVVSVTGTEKKICSICSIRKKITFP